VGLQQLSSKSVALAEKELLLAMAAYHLIRAVMCRAARRGNSVFLWCKPSWKRRCRVWIMPPAKRNSSSGWSACGAMPRRASTPSDRSGDPIREKSGGGAATSQHAKESSQSAPPEMSSPHAGALPVASSLLASVDYDAGAFVLQLQFRSGAFYRYFDVSQSTYQALLAADSKGSFFNSSIKGRFPFALVKTPLCPPAKDTALSSDN
jgi:KTSC domain